MNNLLETQVGGSHYLSAYQTIEYCCNNDLNGFQLSILKYAVRHKKKNGREDLLKATDWCEKGRLLNPANHATYDQRNAKMFVEANVLEKDFDHFLYYLAYQDWDSCISYIKRMIRDHYGDID